jgi:nicotinate phosphoribosyltransferase
VSLQKNKLHDVYKPSLALLNDLYQISMAYGYWKSGRHNYEAMFQLFFRTIPFNGGFAVAAGLDAVVDYVQDFSWSKEDLEYIGSICGADGKPIVCHEFLDYLKNTPLSVSIDAVEEGRVVFAHEPLVRVSGPLLQCQMLETPLLNLINFPTLIATKAARVRLAAQGDRVLEFGVRRAQGIDGGLTASRAAFIGGVDGTSNLLAGSTYGIPVSGTHAHSWVMSFDSELESFKAYADAMPGNCLFLVDTFNTLAGVKNAVLAGQYLQSRGGKLLGIRLDSGDLGYLSIEARKILDAAGFKDAVIVGSNDLDENQILNLKTAGAKINVWGVGTKLVTAYDDPALGGVYKLVAIRKDKAADWSYKLKLSEQISKITTPGKQQVRRFKNAGEYLADMIYDELSLPLAEDFTIVDPLDVNRRKKIPKDCQFEDLLVPIFDQGLCVYDRSGILAARQRCKRDLGLLNESVKRIVNPYSYPVGLEQTLSDHKSKMILDLRGF